MYDFMIKVTALITIQPVQCVMKLPKIPPEPNAIIRILQRSFLLLNVRSPMFVMVK